MVLLLSTPHLVAPEQSILVPMAKLLIMLALVQLLMMLLL
jgi:hypothetical protein